LAVRVGRKDRSFNFGLSLGVIVFYYLLFALGEALALKKLLPVAFGVWLPNLALSAIGAFLIFRFSKR
jgi:lipopolysaccharide export LptBFGC system permease protein LptF